MIKTQFDVNLHIFGKIMGEEYINKLCPWPYFLEHEIIHHTSCDSTQQN